MKLSDRCRQLIAIADPQTRTDELSDKEVVAEALSLAEYAIGQWRKTQEIKTRVDSRSTRLLVVPESVLAEYGIPVSEFGIKAYDSNPTRMDDSSMTKRVLKWQGLRIGITHEADKDYRFGTKMLSHYGRLFGSYGDADDKMAHDFFVPDDAGDDHKIWAIQQLKPDTGEKDETKFGIFKSAQDFKKVYQGMLPNHLKDKMFGGVWEVDSKEFDRYRVDGIRQDSTRVSCLGCVEKHLGNALALLDETTQGYPQHRVLAIGNLSQAADEAAQEYPELAEQIRDMRHRYQFDGVIPTVDEVYALLEPYLVNEPEFAMTIDGKTPTKDDVHYNYEDNGNPCQNCVHWGGLTGEVDEDEHEEGRCKLLKDTVWSLASCDRWKRKGVRQDAVKKRIWVKNSKVEGGGYYQTRMVGESKPTKSSSRLGVGLLAGGATIAAGAAAAIALRHRQKQQQEPPISYIPLTPPAAKGGINKGAIAAGAIGLTGLGTATAIGLSRRGQGQNPSPDAPNQKAAQAEQLLDHSPGEIPEYYNFSGDNLYVKAANFEPDSEARTQYEQLIKSFPMEGDLRTAVMWHSDKDATKGTGRTLVATVIQDGEPRTIARGAIDSGQTDPMGRRIMNYVTAVMPKGVSADGLPDDWMHQVFEQDPKLKELLIRGEKARDDDDVIAAHAEISERLKSININIQSSDQRSKFVSAPDVLREREERLRKFREGKNASAETTKKAEEEAKKTEPAISTTASIRVSDEELSKLTRDTTTGVPGIEDTFFVKDEQGNRQIFKGSNQARFVVNEVLISEIGLNSGIPVNQARLVRTEQDSTLKMDGRSASLHSLVPGENLYNAVGKKYPTISRNVEEVVKKSISQHPDLATNLALDIFTCNTDNHENNYMYDAANDRIYGIDKGRSFYFGSAADRFAKDFIKLNEQGVFDNLPDREKANISLFLDTLQDLHDRNPPNQTINKHIEYFMEAKPRHINGQRVLELLPEVERINKIQDLRERENAWTALRQSSRLNRESLDLDEAEIVLNTHRAIREAYQAIGDLLEYRGKTKL